MECTNKTKISTKPLSFYLPFSQSIHGISNFIKINRHRVAQSWCQNRFKLFTSQIFLHATTKTDKKITHQKKRRHIAMIILHFSSVCEHFCLLIPFSMCSGTLDVLIRLKDTIQCMLHARILNIWTCIRITQRQAF